MVGHLRLVEDLVEGSIPIREGSAAVSDGPGLGITVTQERIARMGLQRNAS
jgi:L-alanine-DL-glutamate epimerase-like enolase superfamily enzyme